MNDLHSLTITNHDITKKNLPHAFDSFNIRIVLSRMMTFCQCLLEMLNDILSMEWEADNFWLLSYMCVVEVANRYLRRWRLL